MTITFWIFCGLVIFFGGIYLIASIQEYKDEAKKQKDHDKDFSFKEFDWKKFKNTPWQ